MVCVWEGVGVVGVVFLILGADVIGSQSYDIMDRCE